MNTKIMHYRLRRLCALAIGIVFLIAGIFKLLDPIGAGLVVEEYYRFLHLGFMLPTAKVVAVALALIEALLGAAMISGVFRKQVAILSTAMIVFFTILTLILAVVDPAMDCGCFGEVIHLTNTQTFLKNLILLVLAMTAFLPFRSFGKNRRRKYVSFSIVAASIVAFTIYSLTTIPLVDYTSFTPGSELMASKIWNEGEEEGEEDGDDYMSTFIYERNGQEGAFTLDKLPDSTWTFVRTETIRRVGPDFGDSVPILSFTDENGNYMDDMAASGNVLAVSVYDAGNLKGGVWTRLAEALDGAKESGFVPLLLVSAKGGTLDSLSMAMVPEVRDRLLPYTYTCDRRTLLALNRSNGGATWFNDGQLIRKFPNDKLPTGEDLLAMTGDDPTEVMLRVSTKGRLRFQGFVLYVLAILLVL